MSRKLAEVVPVLRYPPTWSQWQSFLEWEEEKCIPSRKAFRQMRDRLREGIIKKAHEYSKLCSADVCVGIRLRDSGQVYRLHVLS